MILKDAYYQNFNVLTKPSNNKEQIDRINRRTIMPITPLRSKALFVAGILIDDLIKQL